MKEKEIVICDIDGTVANNDHRQHLLKDHGDWDKFFEQLDKDKPLKEIIYMVEKKHKEGKKICFITGRPERYRKKTERWLKQNLDLDFSLIMRKDKDRRNKLETKKELFQVNFIVDDIDCCFENDPELIELWKEMGLLVIDANQIIIPS